MLEFVFSSQENETKSGHCFEEAQFVLSSREIVEDPCTLRILVPACWCVCCDFLSYVEDHITNTEGILAEINPNLHLVSELSIHLDSLFNLDSLLLVQVLEVDELALLVKDHELVEPSISLSHLV